MASTWILIGFTIAIGVLVTIITVWFWIWKSRQTAMIDVQPNAPIIDITTRAHLTDGYCFGLVKSEQPRKNGTHLIEFYPTDSKQGWDMSRPKLQSLIVAKGMINRFSRGDRSSRREVVQILARSNADLPEKMRGTHEGDFLSKKGQLAHITKTFGQGIVAGDEAISDAMTMFSRGNIARATLASIREEIQERMKLMPSNQEPGGKQ